MSFLRRFGRFWYDFIVGDDWRIAASVLALCAATALAARQWDLWPLLPVGVAATLAISLRRAASAARAHDDPTRRAEPT